MVSLCLTKPHIDGRISVVSDTTEEPQQQTLSAGKTTFRNRNNVNDDRSIQKSSTFVNDSDGNVYLDDRESPYLFSQANDEPKVTAVDRQPYRERTHTVTSNKLNGPTPVKSITEPDSSAKNRKHKFNYSDKSAIDRRNSMLATVKAMGSPQYRRLSDAKTKKNLHCYKEYLVDARKEKYRVHKWRAKSGRNIESNSSMMQNTVLKLQKKIQETRERYEKKRTDAQKAIQLPRPIGNVKKTLPTTHPANTLDASLDDKERLFGLQRTKSEKHDNNLERAAAKDRPFLVRLRHHIRKSTHVEVDTKEFPDDSNQTPSSMYSTPENIPIAFSSKLGRIYEQPLMDNYAPVISDRSLSLANKYGSALPPIASEVRRRSYPTRTKPKILDQSNIKPRRQRGFSLHPAIGSSISIPEDEPISLIPPIPNQRTAIDKLQSKHDKTSADYKASKGSEPPLGSSPTNKKTHSSMTMYSVGGTTRSSSKEGKEGDTPTDSEGSFGASKHRMKLRKGSRRLSKMESRNSPQAFRYIKPARMDKLMRQWYIYAKLSIWLARLCNSHHIVVDDSYNIQSGTSVAEDVAGSGIKKEVLFDVTDYKMKNQLRLSDTTRRILSQPTEKRTEKDVNLVQTALRNIKAIADYSNAVQKQIGRHGYFVGFEGRRVVVQEGRTPLNYHLLLAGSAVVIKSDENGNTNPVLFMKRGDVFGENEILENTKWQWSIATSGYCEFLLLERDAYRNIFITGGGGGLLSDPERGGFLRSIPLLQQWPIEVLKENPNRCLFRYFKRGALLVNDNASSEWIFVVKSGSCSVLKKLMVETLEDGEVIRRTKKEQEFRSEYSLKPHLVEQSEAIDKEDHIYKLAQKEQDEKNKDVSVLQQLEMSSILKELNSEVIGNSASPRAEAGFDDGRSDIPLSSYRGDITARRSSTDRPVAPTNDKSKFVEREQDDGFRLSRHSDRHPPRTPSPTKAAYLRTGVSSRMAADTDEENKQEQKTGPPTIVVTDTNKSEVKRSSLISPQKQVHINEFLFGINSPDEPTEEQQEEQVFRPIHINVRRLTRKDMFGIGPHLFTNQPSLALVSNGAECLMLHKKFYLENASEDCLSFLREAEYPYPSDEELMEQHWRLRSWKAYQAKAVREVLQRKTLLI